MKYDATADAAKIYLDGPIPPGGAVKTYPCDPVEVGGMINLDFDVDGRLIGIEVLAARSKLPSNLLRDAQTHGESD